MNILNINDTKLYYVGGVVRDEILGLESFDVDMVYEGNAIEFAETLKECGVKRLPAIAETQTIVYTCRKVDEDSSIIYAMKKQVDIAGLKGVDIGCVVNRLPRCLRQYFRPVPAEYRCSRILRLRPA